jgi:hypothetical protein
MVTVASFWCDRRDDYPDAPDYLPLLALLQKSCDRFGLRHVVLSDALVPGFETFVSPMPRALMPATLFAHRAWIAGGDWKEGTALVGADCLIGRDLRECFDGSFDLLFTSRPGHRRWPINTGLICVTEEARIRAAHAWARAAADCTAEWGNDQVQIARMVEPIPEDHGIVERRGMRVKFAPLATHNFTPKRPEIASDAFVVHFKGPRKAMMGPWAQQHLEIVA